MHICLFFSFVFLYMQSLNAPNCAFPFHLQCVVSKVMWHTFMAWKDSTTTIYFLLVRYSNKAREEKKFSTYNLHTTPSPLLVRCLTFKCVGVILLVAFLDSFTNVKFHFICAACHVRNLVNSLTKIFVLLMYKPHENYPISEFQLTLSSKKC